MTKDVVGDSEVLSDGKTVWVNKNGECRARYTTGLSEYPGDDVCSFVRHCVYVDLSDAWEDFVAWVRWRLKVVVKDTHRPEPEA